MDPLAAGYWLLVTGCWLLVIGYWSLVTGCWLLAPGYRGLEAGMRTIGCWLLAVLDHWLWNGGWLLWTGQWCKDHPKVRGKHEGNGGHCPKKQKGAEEAKREWRTI